MSVVEDYTNEIQAQLGYLAAWFPSQKLAVGDIGTIQGRVFHRVKKLNTEDDAAFQTEGSSLTSMVCSSKGVSVHAGNAGANTGLPSIKNLGEFNVKVEFQNERAVLFHAINCKSEIVNDINLLEETIRLQSDLSEWKSNWVVITEVVSCQRCTVLVSSGKQAHLEINSSNEIPASLNLANIDAGFTIAREQGIQTRFIAHEGLTPLYKAYRLKRTLFGKNKLETVRQGTPKEEMLWEEVRFGVND